MPYKDPQKRADAIKKWALRHPDKVAQYAEISRQRRNEYSAKWKREHPEHYFKASRNRHLKANYGITLDDYNKIYEDQSGLCAICKRPESRLFNQYGKCRHLAVDHNHDTKQVRGLLCGACNQAIGLFDEDILRMEAAIMYLKTHTGEN